MIAIRGHPLFSPPSSSPLTSGTGDLFYPEPPRVVCGKILCQRQLAGGMVVTIVMIIKYHVGG